MNTDWVELMSTDLKVEWKIVNQDHAGYLYRAKVEGGYLWRFCDPVPFKHDDGKIDWNHSFHNSITFQPDWMLPDGPTR